MKKSRGREHRDFFGCVGFNQVFNVTEDAEDIWLLTAFIKRALRRMVNARTGGGLSLLKGRAFSTPAAPKKSRASGALRV